MYQGALPGGNRLNDVPQGDGFQCRLERDGSSSLWMCTSVEVSGKSGRVDIDGVEGDTLLSFFYIRPRKISSSGEKAA